MKTVGCLFFSALLLCIIPALPAWSGFKEAQALYERGVALQRAGKVEEALSNYRKAVREDMEHREAMYAEGTALYELGRYKDAARSLKEYLSFHPGDLRALSLLARIDLASGSAQEARKLLLKVFARYPRDVPTLVGLGQAEQMLGNGFAAERYFRKAAAVDPKNAGLQLMVRKAREANREFVAAREAAKRRKILTAFNKALWEASRQWAESGAPAVQQSQSRSRSRNSGIHVQTGGYTSFSGPSFSIGSGLLIPFPTVGASGTQVQFVGS